ncbi:chemotaxis protein CheB [Dyadobacter chenhuakuii]|uniref:protein-glutamate methylesterase n=1 Tax=Dyadobacter chenhuakuii TaxID=2909339 RepID=A0ABY4XPZ5_9BACT|nr:chemotaxis protein CheB [Dyadobacter chenhuakuii]MCF2493252.1 chemotaxis protein CheB [Dyadobacter chenhuakuii]USJ32465.1 chemotaxis protein CheB [Dyadobacter chenhuakuii]
MNSAKDESLSLVLMGGSSGSFVILEDIIKLLKGPISFAVIFVLHRGRYSSSVLPDLFKTKTDVHMSEPHHLDPITSNTIYFALPDYHLLVGEDHRFYYDHTEPDFFSRPSIDATFMSAAMSGIPLKAAMLFSGSSQDGAAGLKLLAEKGCPTYVQSPAFAEFPRMPEEALLKYQKHKLLEENGFYETISDLLS